MAEIALCEQDVSDDELAALWHTLRREGVEAAEQDAQAAHPIAHAVLRHAHFADALAHRIADKLADDALRQPALLGLVADTLALAPSVVRGAARDLLAVRERDPASPDLLTPFLFFKGYLALQAYRVSHVLWQRDRRMLARQIQSRTSEAFGVDIHPAARIGCGVMVDHATGLVIGETTVIGDDVSILQGVTLGGTGKECGDRHPKIQRGVLLGAGAKVLGNIVVGEGAKVGAGSIVLDDVAPYTTVVGVPARPVGARLTAPAALTMDQSIPAPDYSI